MMDWTTVGIIIATGVVTSVGMLFSNWIQNRWSIKRDIRDARRKYREEIASKIREALGKIQENRSWINISNIVLDTVRSRGLEMDSEKRKVFEELKEIKEARQVHGITKDFVPLVSTITDERTREIIEKTVADTLMNSSDFNVTTDDEVEEQIKLAYKQLENFVALAD